MGGRYGPEYAGHDQLVQRDGIHGLGICHFGPDGGPATNTSRYRMVCPYGHTGPVMDLCPAHVQTITARMSGTCTRCAQPEASLQLEGLMESCMRSISEAAAQRDLARVRALQAGLDDLRHKMDELLATGVIRARVPLKLVEIS
jgi:hypothetical protein